MDNNDYCLYVIVRTNLESMNAGKAMAHASHAANQFVFEQYIDSSHEEQREQVLAWMDQTEHGFGTQIVLKADDWDDVWSLNDTLNVSFSELMYSIVIDPSYPFEVTSEIYEMLKPQYKDDAVQKKNGMWVCHRNEETAFYIFGRRSDRDLQSLLKKFKLHP